MTIFPSEFVLFLLPNDFNQCNQINGEIVNPGIDNPASLTQ